MKGKKKEGEVKGKEMCGKRLGLGQQPNDD